MCDIVSASDAVPGWVLFFLKSCLKDDFRGCIPSFSMSSFVSLAILTDQQYPKLSVNDRSGFLAPLRRLEENVPTWSPRKQVKVGSWVGQVP